MKNLITDYNLTVSEPTLTNFKREENIVQDGTIPMCRDTEGTLWAISGHTNVGRVSMFKGTNIDDMQEAWEIKLNFCVGHADYSYDGVRYPEGIKSVGSMWPFGLYICPGTNRFFCFFHNESAWNGKGTGYDAYGICADDKPRNDSDFRHIGLMHSDDCGKNWTFDRWVLTGERPACTEAFNAGAGNVRGQKMEEIHLGSGDFSLFIDPKSEYMYLFYDIIRQNAVTEEWLSIDVYVARARKRDDGIMTDFVKYYDGSFSEPGNLGRETIILPNAWHPRVVYSEELGAYIMSYTGVIPGAVDSLLDDNMHLRTSTDLINWSEPITVEKDGTPIENKYFAILSNETDAQPYHLKGNKFSVLSNTHCRTSVHHTATFTKK
ncbi:MAG: hypothetical protein IKA64_06845 [Clostridia bacterium]|nr:hypothetical protein [Clostridia bacterium]